MSNWMLSRQPVDKEPHWIPHSFVLFKPHKNTYLLRRIFQFNFGSRTLLETLFLYGVTLVLSNFDFSTLASVFGLGNLKKYSPIKR